MKVLFLSIFTFFYLIQLNGQQTIQGKIVNQSDEPLEAVYVYFESSETGVVSNLDGEFQLAIPEGIDSLTIDSYEHNLKKVAVQDLLKNPIIKLEEFAIVLNEALILNKKGHEILNDIVTASKIKLDKSLLVNTFYREFISINNDFTSYSDGLLDFYIKKKSGKSDVYVLQSRTFELEDKENKEGKEVLAISSPYDIKDAISSAFKFNDITEILKKKEFYDYKITEFNDSEGMKLRKIEISPKEDAKEFLSMGSVIYDVESSLILDYNLKAAPEKIQYSKLRNFVIAKIKINDYNRHFNFRLDNGKYRLVFRRLDFDCYIKSGKMVDDNYQFTNDFVVIGYKENVEPPTHLEKYKLRNLFEGGTNFTTEYWKDINAITPTKKEQELIDSLQK
uniref:Carboxypeptidase-like regulatory domain-containing protein n=1 Tax=uncultured bacterium TB303_p TaxID=1552134 RepID=A0A0K0LBG7_9BACT|nr:hypothetical protein [uncultured bacterium TB303_p]